MKRAVLFDLDDTLIFAYANPAPARHAVVHEFADGLAGHAPRAVAAAIAESIAGFLSDDDNRRRWRLQAIATRRSVVRDAVLAAGFTGVYAVADAIADRYAAYREENMYRYPDALAVIDTFRARGFKLGLVTNGATEVQNAKIDRFGLRHRFDHTQVEEDAGFGKPDGRAYVHTLAALAVDPGDATMIGDDLVWDVLAPKRLGMTSIWYDPFGLGLALGAPVVPDLRILRLLELLDD